MRSKIASLLSVTLVLLIVVSVKAIDVMPTNARKPSKPSTVTVSLQASPPEDYRWLDVASNLYSDSYRATYTHSSANVKVSFSTTSSVL